MQPNGTHLQSYTQLHKASNLLTYDVSYSYTTDQAHAIHVHFRTLTLFNMMNECRLITLYIQILSSRIKALYHEGICETKVQKRTTTFQAAMCFSLIQASCNKIQPSKSHIHNVEYWQ
jgi:hypothetical protein